MKLFFLFIFISLTSCANYVRNLHKQISNQENGIDESRGGSPAGKQLNYFRTKEFDKRPVKDPISFSTTPNTDVKPEVTREYRAYKKRLTVNDIADNSPAPSLWANYTNTSNLFTTNKRKTQGDIVVIAVNKNMKEDISRELRKAFPKEIPRPIALSKKPSSLNGNPEIDGQVNTANSANPQAPKKEEEDKEEAIIIFDKVSSHVSEEIGQDYMLLKGRKEVYFRNKKRLVELHALAKRSSVSATDEVMSDSVTESKVFIIR